MLDLVEVAIGKGIPTQLHPGDIGQTVSHSPFTDVQDLTSLNTLLTGRGEAVKPVDAQELDGMRRVAFARMENMGLVTVHEFLDADGQTDRFVEIKDLTFITEHHASVLSKENNEETLRLKEITQRAAGNIFRDDRLGSRRMDRTLYWLFKDEKVLTSADLHAQQLSTSNRDFAPSNLTFRSLFFVPDSEQAVFDTNYHSASVDSYYLLYSSVCTDYSSVHPTKDQDFTSGVSVFDVVTPQIIYGIGKGARDDLGCLTVERDQRGVKARKRITGEWIGKYAAGTISTRDRIGWKYSPSEMVELYGSRLVDEGVLKLEDFPKRVLRQDCISDHGVYYENAREGKRRYYIGNNDRLIGGQVVRLSDTDRIVIKDGQPVLWFSTNIQPKHMRDVHTYSASPGSVVIYIPESALTKQDITDMTVSFHRYDGSGGRTRTDIRMADELPNLLAFREIYKQNIPDFTDLNRLSMEDQMILARMVNESSGKQAWKFIQTYRGQAMHVMVDGYRHGGFNTEIYGLAQSHDQRVVHMFDEYQEIHNEIQLLQERMSILDRTLGVKSPDGYQIFLSRVFDALELRSRDFFVLASKESSPEEVGVQMKLFSNTIGSMVEIITSHPTFTEFPNMDRSTGAITSTTQVYKLSDTETVKFTFRPEAIDGELGKTRAGARFGVEYQHATASRFNIRVDFDERGLSVDIGNHEGRLNELMYKHNMPNRTRPTFDQPLQLTRLFGSYVRYLQDSFSKR